MVPNHLFQLVAMTAMEPPVSFDAEDIRAKKAEMFKAIHPLSLSDVVRGQYDAASWRTSCARLSRGANVAPNPHRNLCRHAAADRQLALGGVPFYLRTGKRLPTAITEIAIRFKQAPFALFRETPVEELDADWLILRIQPDEGIRLRFNAKRPARHGAGKRGDGIQIQGLFQAGAGGGL
jgi:glucose-6-phosphate 1-dehydrogenase